MVFYDMGDNIHDNRNDKNNGEKFKEIEGEDNYTAETVAALMQAHSHALP